MTHNVDDSTTSSDADILDADCQGRGRIMSSYLAVVVDRQVVAKRL